MAKYRNTRTGATRESSSRLGFPFVLEEENGGASGLSSMRKAELVELAAARGLDTEGLTADELRAAITQAGG